MVRTKTALISPAIAAQQMPPGPQDESRLFEDKFGQMAYQAFSSKFPDLVPDIVTFKILDTDMEGGVSVAAFILEQEGEYIYVPAILSENELKPFDLMYLKSRDIFLPLNTKWIEEIQKNTISSMGEGTELPETVQSDVDIRHVMTPPRTGRYSFASVSDTARAEAEATEPLGRRIAKVAALGDFPDPSQGGQGGQGQPGGGGGNAAPQFDPSQWAAFVQQYQSTQGMTPGQALDQGMMDIDALGKLYKTHVKAWSDPQLPAQQGAAPQGMPQDPAAMQGAPGMQVTASFRKTAVAPGVKTIGQKIDDIVHNAVRSGAIGAGSGGIIAASDGDWRDVPGAMMRGSVGGALMGPLGHMVGEEAYAHMPDRINLDKARKIGRIGGSVIGGGIGARSEPVQVQIVPNGRDPGFFSTAASLVMPPGLSMLRTASDYQEGLKAMLKHAMAPSNYEPYLPSFLERAPNYVKKAFIQVLDKNPSLLKQAAEIYGADTLLNSLRETKTAGSTESQMPLRMATSSTTPTEYRDYFGEGAPSAYQNVLRRGYYYEDGRRNLKMAVQVQKYHDFQNALDSGIYRLFTSDGTPEGALVLVEPLSLFEEDRATFPHDGNRVKPVRNRVPKSDYNREPNALTSFSFESDKSPTPLEESHKFKRLAVLEDGRYMLTDHLFGEQVSESFLKGTTLHGALLKGDGKPTRGKGFFVGRAGGGWVGTEPLEITEMTNGTTGRISGKILDSQGWSRKSFVIDPSARSNRPLRPRGNSLAIIPASWRWVPLKGELDRGELLTDPAALQRMVVDRFSTDPDVKIASVRADGSGLFVLGTGRQSESKSNALYKLAHQYQVHASAAEAMLKIASVEGVCQAFIVPPELYHGVQERVKIAQGALPPQIPQGAPPAMMPPMPSGGPGGAPGAMPSPGAMPPAEAMPPAPPPPSPVDQAFGESLDGLQQQMTQLQSQMDVLMSVQQRAQQISAEQGGGMPDPSMQGMPPGMDSTMAQDPNAMGGDPSMQDPSMQDPTAGQLPIMRTESPSSEEIANQISPDFLEQAGQLHETGAFDAATLASLAQNSTLKNITSQYAANLENTVDDLGRTLLTLYMQEPKLKGQLGDETYLNLETQLRDTFHGLGELVLALTHNSAMLDANANP